MQQISPEVEQAFQELLKPIQERIEVQKERDQQNDLLIKNLYTQMQELKTLITTLKPLK